MWSTKVDPPTRTVLQPLSHHFDLPNHTTVTSLSISHLAIYAGTDTGTLHLLPLDPDPPASPTKKHIPIGPHSIDSIHLVPNIGSVLVVSGGFLYLLDLELVQVGKRVGNFRGVSVVARRRFSNSEVGSGTSFGVDEGGAGGESWIRKRFGGGVRSNGVRNFKEFESSCDGDGGGGCVFAVAMGKKVVIVELSGRDGEMAVLKEMLGVEGVKAMVWLDDSIVLGTSDGYKLMSCVTGQISLIFSLPDRAVRPCLKLLSRDKKVLLLVDNAGIVVDGYGQPVGGSLVFSRAPDSVAELYAYVVVARDGKVELYHKKSGACVQALSLGASVGGSRCFVADEEDGDGSFVAVAASSKVFCYHMIPSEEQIRDVLRKKNFKEAISLVEEFEADGNMSKEMLSSAHAQVGFLLLFDLHFEEAVDHFLLSEAMQPSEIFPFVIRDPNRWSLLVPRNRYWGLHPPPAHIEDVVEDGLSAIQRAIILKKAGVETSIDNQFILNPPCRADLLESAFRNIIRYLQATRNKDHNQAVKEGVDTLLMYLFRSLNCNEDMEKLASSENNCVVEELETLLEESGHLRTLAFLYANKGISSKALAIWRVLARNCPSDLELDTAETHNSNDTHPLPPFSKETAAIEASKILEESADEELILQHFGWISEISEELAVRVLTSEKRTSPLPPENVIAAIDPRKVEILQRYLQWLIEDQDSSDTQLHTLYAISLAKSALESLLAEIYMQPANDSSTMDGNGCNIRRNPLPENQVRERLQIFLHSSDLYDAEEVLELIEGSELWLEKAILYRKLGQEMLVLQILALKLEDSESAEQYCAELGRPDAYMQLLDMYLDPQNDKEPMFKAAVRLLHNHGESLDPLQVLERLSPEVPLQLASETILRMLRARLHHQHQGKIVHSLSRAVDVDARLARLEERSRFVQISDESLCDSCHARLGTKLFAMYPDDSIVCYKCFRRQGESTSVTGRNFKNDILIKPGWLVSS